MSPPAEKEASPPGLAERLRTNGHLCILLGAFCFGAMSVLVKTVPADIPVGAILFVRFVVGGILMYLLFRVSEGPIRFRDKRFLLSRSVCGVLAVFLMYTAIRRIPVGNAVTYNNTYPIWIAVYLLVWDRALPRARVLLGLAASFLGIWLVADPHFQGLGAFGPGDAAGLASGMVAAFAVLSVKASRRRNSAAAVLLFFSIFGALVTWPFVLGLGAPGLSAALSLLGVALAGTGGQLLMNHGMKYVQAAEGAIVNTVTVVVSASLGALVFGDLYTHRFFIGVGLLFGAAGYLTFVRTRGREG